MGGTGLGEVDIGLGKVDTGLGEVDTGLELDSTGLEGAVAGLAAGMEEAEEAGHLDLLGDKTCRVKLHVVLCPDPTLLRSRRNGLVNKSNFLG